MKKHIYFSILLLLTASFMVVGFIYQTKNTQAPAPITEPREIVNTATTTLETEPEIVPVISLEEKVGQLFLIGHWADTPLGSTTELVEKNYLGGVVVMSAPEETNDIKNWTSTWNEVSQTPLYVAIDQEGGPVSRLKGDSFVQTSQRDIVKEDTSYEIGRIRGNELKKLGINMNFAPVLDSASSSDSFMYERVFPVKASSSALAAAMIAGMSEASVIGVAKHFPGHDDTADDSHHILPTVDIERSELDTFALPFLELIRDQEPAAIMTAHILFPNIDTSPASLSPFFLTNYLREELEFSGLIITDDMSMKAIVDNWTSEAASVLALRAGADIVLFAAEPDKVTAAITAVIAAVETGQLSEDRINESYERIINAKQGIQ